MPAKILDKVLSARFLMAVVVTVGAMCLAFFLVHKLPDSAPVVWTGVTNVWIVIVKDYFARDDREKPAQSTATVTTETTQ